MPWLKYDPPLSESVTPQRVCGVPDVKPGSAINTYWLTEYTRNALAFTMIASDGMSHNSHMIRELRYHLKSRQFVVSLRRFNSEGERGWRVVWQFATPSLDCAVAEYNRYDRVAFKDPTEFTVCTDGKMGV